MTYHFIEGWPWRSEEEAPPTFCPVCGKELFRRDWVTVTGDTRYDNLVCDGSGLGARLFHLLPDSVTRGRHYTFRLGRVDLDPVRPADKFDKHTGEAL